MRALAFLRRSGGGVIAFSPLAHGILARNPTESKKKPTATQATLSLKTTMSRMITCLPSNASDKPLIDFDSYKLTLPDSVDLYIS